MARRRTPPRRQPPLAPPAALRRVEVGPDGHEYEVRPVPAARAAKTYRCPGCDHEIRSGSAHLVVWPTDSTLAGGAGQVEDRRHWHTPCWAHRATRGPTRKWS
ncbi:hypothetical protein DQP58_22970 [Mycobacterium colombiense]|uniref:ATP/GTP-binding protein n=1 Tax=Mycobacterium colombiense TaxID=339268 RepID=A0A329K6Y0_9MYCO|nr:hypothetical protein [Mycobacterium colombiense]RAU90552.1 hypothetical protein DQP58_22970 [Mycobacterium colombiense]